MGHTDLHTDELTADPGVLGSPESALLLRILDLLLVAPETSRFTDEFLDEVAGTLSASAASLYAAYDDALKLVARVGTGSAQEQDVVLPGEGFAGATARADDVMTVQGGECSRFLTAGADGTARAPVPTAMIGFPLRYDSHLIGVLVAETAAAGGFNPSDVAAIESIGISRIARILDAVLRMQERVAESARARERAMLSRMLMSTADPRERLSLMARRLAEVAGVSRCFIFEVSEGAQSLIASAGASDDDCEAMEHHARGDIVKLGIGLDRILDSRRPAVMSRGDVLSQKAFAEATEMRCVLALPLVYGGRAAGVAFLDEPGQDAKFATAQVEDLESVADVAALVTQSALIQRRMAEKLATERHRDRMSALHYVLNQARLTLKEKDLTDLLPRGISDGLGYDRVILYLIHGGRFDLAAGHFRRHEKDLEKFLARARRHPPKIGQPSIEVEVFRQGSPQIVPNPATDPRVIKQHQKLLQSPALAVVPIWGTEGVIGVLLADYKYQGLPVTDEDTSLLSILGTGMGAALENVRLYETARREKDKLATLLTESDDAIVILDRDRKIVAFNKASEMLSGVKAAEAIGKHCQEVWCCLDEQGRELTEKACPVATRVEGHRQAQKSYTERILRMRDGTKVDVAATYAFLEGPDGEVEQAMTVVRDLTEHKRWMREHHIASTLQEALLPESPPEGIGVDIGVFYGSATAQAAVGGDFYDFVQLPGGPLAVVIGDVRGKGIDAAHYTAMAKYSLRAYLMEGIAPSAVMARLNDAICSQVEPGEFISLFLGVLDPTRRTLGYANAGHPHPLLHESSHGRWRALEKSGIVLGITPGQRYSEAKVRLGAGDTLLLYTDGLVETRKGPNVFGEERLLQFLNKCRIGTAQQFAERVYQRSATFAGGHLADDVAIVAISL